MMNYELFDILNAGYKTMRANAEKLDECAKAIAECILDAKNQYIHVLQCDDRTAAKLMSLCDAQRYEEMFAHGSTEYRAVAAMIGAENAENAAYIWRNAPRYTYQQYIWRRSFRTKKYIEAYFGKSFDVLFGFITGIAAGFSVERYIEERSKGGKAVAFANERYYVPAVLSAYLEGDRTRADGLFERLRGIVNDEAGHGTLTREIIMGLLMSNRDDAHELVASLFIAARLQEGLRQSIMEAVDECDVKAFMLIFKTVMDNNLSRYSSVVRAFCVWIGIDLDVSAPKKVKGALETAYRCLTNETFRRECVNGENPIDTIIALWATSFDGIEYAEELVRRMLRDGPRHKKLAGLFFASGLQQSTLQYRLASECLYNPEDRKDNEIMAWVLRCLGGVAAVELAENPHVFYSRSNVLRVPAAELKRLYYTLKELVETFGEKNKKGVVFENSVIEGFRAEYSRDGLLSRMAALLSAPHAAILNYHHSNRDDIPDHPLEVVGEMRDDLCGYAEKMDTDTRGRLIHHVVAKGATPVQRAALIAALGYRSEWNVKAAWKHVENLPLTDEEILQLEGFLRFKNGKMRQYIFLKLLAQEPEKLGASISRLLADRDKMRVAAGEELLTLLAKKKGEAKYEGIYANLISSPIPRHTESSASGANAGNDKLPKTAKEEPISPAWDRTDGYGLFDPASPVRKFKIPSLPDGFDLAEVYALDLDRVQTFYDAFDAAFHAHRDYEYEGSFLYCYDSPNGKVLLGERERIVPLKAAKVFDRNGLSLDEYPLADLWRTTLAAAGADGAFLYRLHTLHRIRRTIRIDDEKTGRLDELSGVDDLLACARDADAILNKAVYGCKTYDLLPILRKEFSGDEIFRLAYDLWRWFLSLVGTHGKREFVNFDDNWIIDDIEALDMTGEQFVEYFGLAWEWCGRREVHAAGSSPLGLDSLARALKMGIVNGGDVTRHALTIPKKTPLMWSLFGLKSLRLKSGDRGALTPEMEVLRDTICSRVVEIETRRGEMATDASWIAGNIAHFTGARHFVDLLARCESDPFERNLGSWNVDENCTKKIMLSHLLRNCHPAKGEDETTLRSLLVGKKISDKLLIEGAMYAPQWIGIVGRYLGWEGFESACWYFQAHVNEHFSSEKETMVARFSDIAPQDFNDGAFDIAWFEEAYKELGAERFTLVYGAAKYISGGANHRRSQLFADAATGKLKLGDAEKEVTAKRNKNYVLCYALVPLDQKNPTADALHRYEALQNFLRESKGFGAQRRESEARAVQIATENLARNAGYASATRFIWSMEGEKLESVKPYFEKKNLEGTDVWLEIGSSGKAELMIAKGGKILSDVPSKLKKDPYIAEIKATRKSLLDQHSRARTALERAMERGESFEADELEKLSVHPVIGPLLGNLVFKTGDNLSYLSDLLSVKPSGEIVIAHSFDLYESGRWHEFQTDLFDRQIVQPFKQVFRELYLPNADELAEAVASRRYAGHQVQPARGVALLKTRGWTVHYEEGLQRVFHKEDLIAIICAVADWFSPADIEPPTLETVQFFTRKGYKPVALADVPPKIFSEVMRDVDLMVSVAHVGGIDPEASHSTIEMRRAIAAEAARLFRLNNVKFKDSHAIVAGSRGEYSIHLGSAIVHKIAGGALHVLAVPSQHRGKIFLPFVDEDPRTAEVVSKILLFAEDSKIKDPSILSQS